jgi:hypothetical protein
MGTGDGTENAHGRPECSAAAAAPQEVSSRMTTSGWCASMAAPRSATWGRARRPELVEGAQECAEPGACLPVRRVEGGELRGEDLGLDADRAEQVDLVLARPDDDPVPAALELLQRRDQRVEPARDGFDEGEEGGRGGAGRAGFRCHGE